MINKIPILTFHSLDNDGSVISFNPARFKKILTILKSKGYTAISLHDLIEWMDSKQSLESPAFVITFDDGFENLYHHAFPVLEEYGFQATIFLTAGYCGLKNNWHSQPSHIPLKPILTWDQVREMSKTVFDIQAHSINHPYLSQEPSEVVENEITGSKKMIEDKIGKAVDFFAYPYGDYNDLVYKLGSIHYQGACSVDLNFTTVNSDRYLLERIDMYYFSFWATTGLFLSPLFLPYLRLRKTLRAIKRQVT